MKKLFFSSLLFTIIFSFCWGQHVVFLKNGGILKGRVEGGPKDTLNLVLLGNKMKIAYSDINAVYFNDSMVSVNANYNFKNQISVVGSPVVSKPAAAPTPTEKPAEVAPASKTDTTATTPVADTAKAAAPQATTPDTVKTPATPPAQVAEEPVVKVTMPTPKTTTPKVAEMPQGGVKGIVSFYITKSNISKPDSAANVWIVDSTQIPQFNIAVVDTFLFGSAYREISNQYKLTGDPVPDEITSQLKIWKATDEKSFDRLSQRTERNINLLKNCPATQNLIVDKNGYFSAAVPSGIYYVLISSQKAKANNLIEKDGKIFCKKITVVKNDNSIIKNSFDVY